MWGMTLGQIYVMLSGMAEYVKLTNPFGSGDDSDKSAAGKRASSTIDKDEFGTLEALSSRIQTFPIVTSKKIEEFGAFEQVMMREVMEGADN